MRIKVFEEGTKIMLILVHSEETIAIASKRWGKKKIKNSNVAP